METRTRMRSRRPDAYDMMRQMSEAYGPMMAGMNRMMGDMAASWTDMMQSAMGLRGSPYAGYRAKRGWRHADNCDCEDCRPCRPGSCECDCCIGDADLAIYTRLGERRLVPVMIENSRRREKTVKLELSGWTTRRGKPVEGLTAAVLPQESFELGPCQSMEALIVVQYIGSTLAQADKEGASFEKTLRDVAGAARGTEKNQRQALPDVEECEVFYADLRVEGCEIRPIRLALAVLPRDCDAYEIHCRCGCC